MAILATDFISINRGGTVEDGDSGTYHVGVVQEILNLVSSVIVSTDAGNILTTGSDAAAFLNEAAIKAAETNTSLGYNPATNVLTYTDEAGAATNLDLSALSQDLKVDGASIDAGGIITFTVDDAGTATDFTLDMSTFINSITDNATAGTVTYASGGGSQTISKTGWMSASLAP